MSSEEAETLYKLPPSVIELIPGRLYLGPQPSKKSGVRIHHLVMRMGITHLVNCMPTPKMYFWDKPKKTPAPLGASEQYITYLKRRYQQALDVATYSEGVSFAVKRDEPPKDAKLFKFISNLATKMKSRPSMRVYVYDGNGAFAAGLVALPLWYFMSSEEVKKKLDPVQEMRSRGKHHVVPEREKAFVQAVKRMCEKDKVSIHPHLFFSKKKK